MGVSTGANAVSVGAMQPDVTPFFTIATTSSGLPSIAIRFWKEHCASGYEPSFGRSARNWEYRSSQAFVQRAYPHVRRDTTAYRGRRLRWPCQRALVASRSDGVPRTSQPLLGSPFLGEGLLLHYQRQHHRRGDTSVSQVS